MQVRERLHKMGPFQPMNIFLRQEVDRMQRVIVLVRNTLTDLKLAIDGTIIMSENLRDALDCMYDARIPARWKKVGGEQRNIKWQPGLAAARGLPSWNSVHSFANAVVI